MNNTAGERDASLADRSACRNAGWFIRSEGKFGSSAVTRGVLNSHAGQFGLATILDFENHYSRKREMPAWRQH